MAGEQTLAQRIKAKFPGEYDDIADAELETRIIAKYPGEYDDLPRSQATAPKDGVGADRALRETLPTFTPPDAADKVYPNSPRDLLERGSKAVFGDAAPLVNRAASTVAGMTPGAIGLGAQMLEGGAPVGGAIGGTLGGIVGGIPGAGALAGAGGAVAGGLERWFRGAPQQASDLTKDAILQGGGELIAPGVSKLVSKAALPLYRSALRPGALSREFGSDLAARGLKEGLPVNTASVDAAKAMTTGSREQAMGMVQAAEEAGAAPITGDELMGAFRGAFGKARKQKVLGKPGALGELKTRVQNMAREFRGTPGKAAVPEGPPKIMRVQSRQQPLAMSGDQALALQEFQLGHQADLAPGRVFQPTEAEVRAARQLGPSTAGVIPPRILNGPAPGPRPPVEFVSPGTPAKPAVKPKPATLKLTRAQEIKEEAQAMAADTFAAQSKGARINAVDDLADRDLAIAAQIAVEKRVPGLDVQNLNTKELLGLLKAMEDAEGRALSGAGHPNMVPDLLAGSLGMAGGGPPVAAGAIGLGRVLRAIGSPSTTSKLAIGMDRGGAFGVKHGDKLTNAVRALAIKLKADRERAEDEQRDKE